VIRFLLTKPVVGYPKPCKQTYPSSPLRETSPSGGHEVLGDVHSCWRRSAEL